MIYSHSLSHSTPDDSNPVAYWPIQNHIIDASTNQNHGEAFQTSFTADRKGLVREALQFKANDQSYVRIPHHQSISLDPAMTMAMWFYYQEQSDAGFHTLLEKTNPDFEGHSRYGMWVYNRGIIEICVEPDQCEGGVALCQRCLDANTRLAENNWYHLTGTYDGNTLKIYINGQLNAEKTYAFQTGIDQTDHEIFLGTDIYDPNPRYLTGRLDEIRLYDQALGLEKVEELAGLTTNTDLQKVSPSSCSVQYNSLSTNIQIQSNCLIRAIRLFHPNGQLVATQNLGNPVPKFDWDLTLLDDGIYFGLVYFADNTRTTFKLFHQ